MVFVYGTLLKGMSRAHMLRSARFLGHASISGHLYDVGAYPAVREGDGVVYGELYEVNEAIMNKLDSIEGYDAADEKHSLFLRKQVSATCLHDAKEYPADTYMYANLIDASCRVDCGDYRRYILEKSDKQTQWYIAYGSNMSSQRLSYRVGKIMAVRRGELVGYRLVFNKIGDDDEVKANLNYVGNDGMCPIVAYALTSEQINKLDRCEGTPRHYIRLGMPFTTDAGDSCLGYIYLAHLKKLTEEGQPTKPYLQYIIDGYEEHGFDTSKLTKYSTTA